MILCPFCDAENIEGADVCEQCEQPLADLHLPSPASELERHLLRDRVGVLNPKAPIVVAPDVSVADVLQLFADKGIGCVFVVDDDKLVGVFSERDALLRLNTDAPDYTQHPISAVMTRNPQDIQADTKIAFAVRMMDLGGYRHVPVVDSDGKTEGVISVRDILRYLTDHMSVGS